MAIPRPAGYSRLQIALHWIVVVLIIVQYVGHEAMVAAWEAFGAHVHVIGGVLVLLLAAARIVLRITQGAPTPPANEPRGLQILAAATHGLIYMLLFAMPISGMMLWGGGIEAAGAVHSTLRFALLGLIALHIVGAVYHAFVLGSDVMSRMIRPKA
jgi:cytochrome b561